ncbi:ABC transporter substrate-binding protein [Rhodococcus sp. NPDC058521]|uniref:ABC transporter substrate-binding protein n=1 Tax=Rhodococcus sp. NPDC058521 TaxID=3346536 RepID=UPI0036639F2F
MRRAKWAAVALMGALVMSACSSGNSGGDDSSGEATVVEHSFGSTTVEGVPERIVAGGSQWVDALLEFGVQPVAYLSAANQGDDRGLYPWQQDVSEDAEELDRSAAMIGAMPPVEQIASYAPDLILTTSTNLNPSSYDQLSGVAPTVPSITDAGVDPWEEQIAVLGRILHEEDRADQIIAERNGDIEALAQRLPGLEGKTAVLSQFMFGTSQFVLVADPEDGAAQTFRRLGMTLPPTLMEEGGVSGGRIMLSAERVDALTADLVVLLPNGGTREGLDALPGFSDLPAVKGGGLAVVDYPTVVAFNTPSSLSLEYGLDKITPQLEAVAGR